MVRKTGSEEDALDALGQQYHCQASRDGPNAGHHVVES